MSSFLPSEVSRLVLGYLEEVECKSAYQAFLNECPHLAECRGRVFFTQIMGYSLAEILDDFCAAQSYLVEISKGDEFRRKVLKCKTLLEKVKLFVDNDGTCAVKQTPPVAKCHKQTSPLAKASQSYSVHRSKRVRSNSCDSVVSTRTDVSACGGGRLGAERRPPHTRSVESLAEATNLADLPGNKRYSTASQTKSYGNNSMYKTIAQAFKDGLNKSLDRAFRGGKYDSDEENFRSALGLVRHSDLPDKQNNSVVKAPLKGKTSGRKHGMTVKKIPHIPDPLPNETLNVTNITHALLDCTEFHEKLAENINKIYSNLSSSKIGDEINNASLPHRTLADSVVKEETITTVDGILPVDGVAVANVEDNTVDEVPQLDTVIKSIVEKTEQDPIFDQLVNEVLAASVESSSDSDIISRPGTSTPEKSSLSQVNESSPTHYRLQDTIDRPFDKQMRYGGKKIHMNYKEKIRSRRLSPFKHTPYNQSQYYSRNKKYPRYPRGGKRMDLLRETYGSSFCENDEDIPTQHKTTVTTETTVETSCKAKKVVILSDEIIKPTCKGLLLNENLPRKELPHIISVSKPEETIIKPCKDSGMSSDTLTQPLTIDTDSERYQNNPVTLIQSYPDPRLQGKQHNEHPNQPVVLKTVHGFDNVNSVSNSLQNMVNTTSNPVRFVNIEQNKTVPLLEVMPQVINLQANNASTSDSSGSSHMNNQNRSNLRRYRKNLKNEVVQDNKTNSFYSEADIMKMPTVFMGPSNNSEGTQPFVPVTTSTELQLQENISVLTNPTNDSDIISHPKLVYREKVPLKSVHGLISTMVHDTNGTHILQIDRGLMGIMPDSVDQTLTTRTELVLATQNEPSIIENHKVVEVLATNDSKDIGCLNNNEGSQGKDVEQLDGKTPNDLVVQKSGSSTPRRTLSHVRVLDFNTPPKSLPEARRAHSSPKMSTRSMTNVSFKPFLTPSTNSRPKSKGIKSKLFPAIPETSREDNEILSPIKECVKIEVIASGVWDEVHGVGQILKKSSPAKNVKSKVSPVNDDIGKTPDNKSANKKKLKVMKPVDKETQLKKEEITEKEFEEEAAAIEWARIRNANKKSWDQEMRLVLASNVPVKVPFNKNYNKKKRKITGGKSVSINLDDSDEMSKSTEDEAKLLEDALNRTTGLTPAKPYEGNEKCLDMIRINNDLKADGTADEQIEDNIPSENNSSQGEIKSDETNNKDYLLQVKLFRDSMKSQNTEACKFVTYSNPHNTQSSAKKPKKTVKSKNTFKVKFTPKHSRDVHVEEEVIEVVDNDTDKQINCNSNNTRVPEIVVSSVVQEECSKIVPIIQEIVPCVSAPVASAVPETSKKDVLFTPVEPPVPAVKITPDMPREHDFNPFYAKCNLNSLLETPFKSGMFDLNADTPSNFISPGFFKNAFSASKLLEGLPTPNFPFLPELTATPGSMCKEPTPGSYSSRRTDYSSSSSYYKPDEIEFSLDPKAQRHKSPPKNLSVVKEETESSPGSEEVSQRVLRPRRSRTIYYPDAVVKSKTEKDDSSNNSLNKSAGKINTSNTAVPLKENIPKVQSKANILPKVSPNKSANESRELSSKKNSKFVDDLNLSSSSSESFMDDGLSKIAAAIKTTSTPNVSSEKRKSEETRKQLEEKRKRVLSKLKNQSNKKSSRTTKVSIKGRRTSSKLSLTRTSISPKPAPVKVNKSMESSTSGNDKEIKEDVSVAAKENNAPVQALKTISSKSRRKSSTPRKLMQSEIASLASPPESISDCDHHLEKLLNKEEKDASNVKNEKAGKEKSQVVTEKNEAVSSSESMEIQAQANASEKSDKASHDEANSTENKAIEDSHNSNIDAVDDEYVSLHLSSDEVDAEPPAKIPLMLEAKPSNDSYDINQIKEFIATTSTKVDNTAFKENFLKQGFDKKSAEAIEMELIGTPSSDVFAIDENNKDPSDSKEQKVSNDIKETKNEEQLIVEKDKRDVVKPNKDVDRKHSSKSSKHSSHHKSSKESSSRESHKSSKDRHKTHYRPTPTKKSPNKSSDTKKSSSKRTPQKSKKKLSLAEYNERKKRESSGKSSKEHRDDKTRRKSDSDRTKKTKEGKESVEVVNTEVAKIVPETQSELKNTVASCVTQSSVPCTVAQPSDTAVASKDTAVASKDMSVQDSKANDTEEGEIEEEVVVWTDYDCTETSSNFFSFVLEGPRGKRRPHKPVDISHFKIKATVFNSLTDDEEVRDIKITEHTSLLDILPDRLKLEKLRRQDKKLKKEKEELEKAELEKAELEKAELEKANVSTKKKLPLEKLFDEMVDSPSSINSLEEIHDLRTIAETKMAVNSILVEESSNNAFFCSPTKYNADPVNTNEHMTSVCDILKKNIIDDDKTPDKILDNIKVDDVGDTTPKDVEESEIIADNRDKLIESPIRHVPPSPVKHVESILEKQLTFADVRKSSDNICDKAPKTDNSSAETTLKNAASTEDLMNFAVIKSVDVNKILKSSVSPDCSASFSGVAVAEKRKRDDTVEPENLSVKKNRLSSPQSLLKKIDIDAVLSKLHGPE